MPLSFGLLVGPLAIVVAAILYLVTRQKVMAIVIASIGTAVSLGTFALIVLAVNSKM